ncbi:alpha-L-fucosidase [Gaoshiqia sp. Z1-71]|uniref:alpha-L-fucosidase n=1 Tax=Gaoshiqia hydrogeniformans TaxID=3290090 RepID=UPI003BF77BC0
MRLLNLFFAIGLLCFFAGCNKVSPPAPFGPLPTERQLAWHELEYYGFIHFNMNTFTNMEWGMGDEKPEQFNPTELDCRQWARVCKEAGMKGIILTAKHHDGFCLWPSAYTEHSVKNSPWKEGKGDVVREFADACEEYGLKFGVYLSPWDRNHADYGKPEYITYFRDQLRELLTNYGEVFEVWFDGANGGTGWYGGANEERRVDKLTYYDWPTTFELVRELQPNAVMFSDGGPDIRWVGNEEGWARPTNWCLLKRDDFAPGVAKDREHLRAGQEDGTHWVPAEVDVSIRPGWYYHTEEDHQVKTLPHLLDIYYHSVGRNGSLLLNFPVDPRGLIHEKDVEQVMKLAAALKADFAENMAKGKKVSASNVRGKSKKYNTEKAFDDDPQTYWATDDDVLQASLVIDFMQPVAFNRFLAQEYIPLGQRVKKFTLEANVDGAWQKIAEETTIGYKRILRFPTVTATQLRFTIDDAKACPLISNIQVFNAPKVLESPVIRRDQQGLVSIAKSDSDTEIYYTVDQSEPGISSLKYSEPFLLNTKAVVKAVAIDPSTQKESPVAVQSFDVSKTNWKLMGEAGTLKNVPVIFDGDPNTAISFASELPADFVVDLGEMLALKGFSYLPDQRQGHSGIIYSYKFYTSKDGRNWGSPVASGEFSNIQNSPVLQQIAFATVDARFVKLSAVTLASDHKKVGMAEFDVVTQ